MYNIVSVESFWVIWYQQKVQSRGFNLTSVLKLYTTSKWRERYCKKKRKKKEPMKKGRSTERKKKIRKKKRKRKKRVSSGLACYWGSEKKEEKKRRCSVCSLLKQDGSRECTLAISRKWSWSLFLWLPVVKATGSFTARQLIYLPYRCYCWY